MTLLMKKSDIPHIYDALDDADWAAIEKIHPALEIFAEATKIFSGQSYATMYAVDEVYSGLTDVLDLEDTRNSNAMAAKIREYQEKLPNQQWIPQILHPNIKLDKSDPKYALKKKVLESYVRSYTATNSSNLRLPSTTPKKKVSHLQQFRKLVKERTGKQGTITEDNPTDAIAEIERYLSEGRVGDAVNELEWWALQKDEFPILRAIARDWMAVPASSVPCEQMFSIAGNTITKNRNCLAPETAEALLCLNSWWRYDGTL